MIEFIRARLKRETCESESGFTLVELIVTISITGVVLGGVTSILLSSLRAEVLDRKVVGLATAEQQLGFWLPADLQSFGDAKTDIDTSPSTGTVSCGAGLPGTRILRLGWFNQADPKSGPTTVDYTIESIDGGPSLVRHACTGTRASTQVLARHLAVASTDVAGGAVAENNAGIVTLRIAIEGGSGAAPSVFQLSSRQRLRSEPGKAPNRPAPPAAPAEPNPCTIGGTGVTITPGTVAKTVVGTLTEAVDIRIQTDGACGALTAKIEGTLGAVPGLGSLAFQPVRPSSEPLYEEWSASIATTSLGWSAGVFSITVLDTGSVIGDAPTGTVTVTEPCGVKSFTASPYSVALNTTGTPPKTTSVLASSVMVTASLGSAQCTTLSARVTPLLGGAAAPVTSIALTGTTTRTGSLGTTTKGWVAGIYKLTLREGSVDLVPEVSVNIAVAAATGCTIDTVVVDPDPVEQMSGTADALPLRRPVRITLAQKVAGTCAKLTASISGPKPGLASVAFSGTGPWTADLPAAKDMWAPGSYTLGLAALGPIIGRTTGGFNVMVGCTVTALNVKPTKVTQIGAGGSRPLKSSVAVSATTTGPCATVSAVAKLDGVVTGSAALTTAGSGSWAGNIANANTEPWKPGVHEVSIVEGPGFDTSVVDPSWPKGAFTVQPGCTAVVKVAGSATLRSGAPGAARQLLATSSLTFTASPSTGCGALAVEIAGPGPGIQTLPLTANGTEATGTISTNATQLWNDGKYSAALSEDGAATGGAAAFVVDPGCTVTAAPLLSSGTANLLAGTGTARAMKSPITVQVSKTTTCGTLAATITPVGTAPAPPVATLDLSTGTATIGGSTQLWKAGAYLIAVTEGGIGSADLPSATLVVLGDCTVSAPAAAPSTATRVTGAAPNRGLPAAIAFNVKASGTCGPLSIAIAGTPTPPVSTVVLDSVGVGSIAAANTWSGAGSYTATLLEKGSPVPGIALASFSIAAGCTVSIGTPSPVPVALSSTGKLTSAVVVAVPSTGTCTGLTVLAEGVTPVGVTSRAVSSSKVTYAAAKEVWGAGTVTLRLAEAGKALTTVGATTMTIKANSGCTISSGPSLSPTSAVLSSTSKLSTNITITVSAKGCGTLTATVARGTATAGPTIGPIALTLSSGTTFKGTINGSLTPWAKGSYLVTLRNNGTATAATKTLTVK